MAEKCTWDPSKHGGKPCPIHSSGMWDENILTKKDKIEKLKAQGYSEEEIEEELKSVGFDDDYDSEFNEDVEYDDDYERSWGPKKDEDDLDEEFEHKDELDKTVKTLIKEGRDLNQIKNYLSSFPTVNFTKQMENYVDKIWNENNESNSNNQNQQAQIQQQESKPAPRTKVAGIKERTENSKKMLTDFINDFVDESDAETFDDKLNFIKNEFDNYYDAYKRDYPNYQDSFTHFLMDSGLGSMYYDDIYDDLLKIGYIDDPKYKDNPEKLERVYGFNLYRAFQKLLEDTQKNKTNKSNLPF